jgi:hypothetical protein
VDARCEVGTARVGVGVARMRVGIGAVGFPHLALFVEIVCGLADTFFRNWFISKTLCCESGKGRADVSTFVRRRGGRRRILTASSDLDSCNRFLLAAGRDRLRGGTGVCPPTRRGRGKGGFAAPECTPHFLFETSKRKRAVHGPKEKMLGRPNGPEGLFGGETGVERIGAGEICEPVSKCAIPWHSNDLKAASCDTGT